MNLHGHGGVDATLDVVGLFKGSPKKASVPPL
jgi:hypothetical protein